MSATTSPSGRVRRRDGFALPLAILALALITAAVAASAASTRAEVVANQAVRAEDHAYQLAEAGLQQFVARRGEAGFCNHCVADPTTGQYRTDTTEMTRVTLVGGYADVISLRVRPRVLGDSVAIFFIRSRGVDTTVKMSGSGMAVYAERTVGQYATFKTARIKPQAMFVSITGFSKNTSGSSLTGVDECATLWACSCPGSDTTITAVAVPTGEYSGYTSNVTGGISSSMSAATLMQKVGIDWNAIVKNNAIPADYTNSYPSSTAIWAVIHITSPSYSIPRDGNGILIAEGDITMAGSRDFDGIMLVGGRVIATGSNPSSGLVISGLNYLLPGAGTPPSGTADNSTLTNNKPFKYNSCNVTKAMALLDSYYAWSNTWLDNVAVW